MTKLDDRTLGRVAFVLIIGALLMLAPGQVAADSGSIEIVNSAVVSEFPEGFRVRVQAKSDHEITSLAVRLRVGQRTRGAYDYLEMLAEGQLADGELFWRTNTSPTYIPPGTAINYNFEVEDASGALLETDQEEFIYHDPRFEWFEVAEGPITVAYHGPVKSRADSILQTILTTLKVMGPLLGAGIDDPIRITMYNNNREMLEALPPGSTTIRRELITEGQAFLQEGTLLVLGGGRGALGTASHEGTHILVFRSGRSIFRRIPPWLHEGLAEYGNVDQTISYDVALEFAIETDRIMPAVLMSALPGDPEDVIIFYGQSRSIVRMMVARWGADKMQELMNTLQSGINMDDALTQVYGVDRIGLSNIWRQGVGAPLLVRIETERVLPTAIPQRVIPLFSLTPQAGVEAIQNTADTSTPPTATATPEPSPTPAPTPTPEQVAAAAPTPQPSPSPAPAPEQKQPEQTGASGTCNASLGGVSGPLDVGFAALMLGLVGLGVRRRRKSLI